MNVIIAGVEWYESRVFEGDQRATASEIDESRFSDNKYFIFKTSDEVLERIEIKTMKTG